MMKRQARAAVHLAVACAAAVACTPRERAWTPEEVAILRSLSPLGEPPPSVGNPQADDPRAAELGHRLFFDRNLSADGSRSCASCHEPERYFTDGRARAEGNARLARNTPSVLVAPWFPLLGWDGHADSMWSQALGPLEDAREMGMTRRAVAEHVESEHASQYEDAFGPLPPLDDAGVERVFVNVGKALEAYQRRLRVEPSPFDRYVEAVTRGDPAGAGHLSPAAVRGLRQFIGEGRCVLCHHGPRLSDGEFHNLGLPEVDGARPEEREGRRHGARELARSALACGGAGATAGCDAVRWTDTSSPLLVGAFRTPSLRNVAETAPYMHGGQLPTLESVVAHYRSAPRVPAVGDRDPVLRQISRSLVTGDLVLVRRERDGRVGMIRS